MANYDYIQLALRGEVKGATATLYSYQIPEAQAQPAWPTAMVEPAAALKRFLNATECYVMQQSPEGHYISLIARRSSPAEGKGDLYMISLLVDNGCALTGRQVMGLFNQLKKAWIEEETLTDEATVTALLEAGIPTEPSMLDAWTYAPATTDSTPDEAAYRTYISHQELEAIFSFPRQPEYEAYRCVLVVSATTSLRPGVKMPRITAPIRKQYDIVCPEGVTSSAQLLYEGERVTLTYSKEGFDSHTESFVVGNPSAYAKYSGSSINIRTAAQTGIRFVRRVPVKVTSTKGAALNGYTISVNGQAVSTAEPYIEFTERDLEPGAEVEILAASNNYAPHKLIISAEEMALKDELLLELKPVEQNVTLRLDFGDGRVLEQEISLERNTPEYNRLHSGSFHGFRANRQVSDDQTEIYNVDLRVSAIRPGRSDSGVLSRMKAPKFINVSDDAAAKDSRPAIDASLPEGMDGPDTDTDDTDDAVNNRRIFTKCRVLIGVAVVLVVAAVAIFFPRGKNADAAQTAETEMLSAEEGENASATATPLSAEEQADIDYLNGSSAWMLSKLKSPMGLSLAEAMRKGDLEALANNDYFAVKDRCTNSRALEMVEMVWRAIGSPNDSGNRRRLSNASNTQESISLHELVNSLAKVRPAENVNERPRPTK